MRRYQEFIDTLLGQTVDYAMQLASRDRAQFENFVKSSQALNMLNTKHIILGPTEPYVNLNTFGNAWFVNKFVIVENADQEISSLNKNDLSKTAIINKNKFEDYMAKLPKDQIYAEDSSAIVLTEYKPNHITYEARAFRDRLAVFSEIYYPKGWQAYIDGQPAEHINADYILRAMVIPQGDHRIEFKFDPASVRVGKIIAAVASSLILLALLAFVVMYYKSKNSIVEDVKKQ